MTMPSGHYVERERAALREVARAAAKLARSAEIRAGDYASSGGHSAHEDAIAVKHAIDAWRRVRP